MNSPMRSFPGDEIADFRANTCEEIGFIMQLRWFAWRNDGIPTDEKFLFRLGKQLGLTRNRFRKLYESVQNCFVLVDGLIRYAKDEERRIEAEQQSSKYREAGKKGAEIKWANASKNRSRVPESDDSQAIPWPSESDGYHHHQTPEVLSTTREGEPPPPPPSTGSSSQTVEEVVSPPKKDTSQPPLTDAEFQEFVVHCAEVRSPDGSQGVSVPGRALCERLRAKFPGVSVSAIVLQLPKFNGQHSPGKWDKMTREHLELETLNQSLKRDVPRKPTERELQYERQMAWAREQTRKQAQT